MTTFSEKHADDLHEGGKHYGATVATLINQIYPQKRHCKEIDATVEVLIKIALDRLRENPLAHPYIDNFHSGARTGFRINRLDGDV
jgi:hypothetical protein